MEKKIGVYICGGCGIGEAVDVEELADTARSEFKAPVFIHPFLCGAEGVGQIRADIAVGKVNAPVIAACSPTSQGRGVRLRSSNDGSRPGKLAGTGCLEP